jgi:hypothetical protein
LFVLLQTLHQSNGKNQRIPGVFPLRGGDYAEFRRFQSRQVFEAVDRKVHLSFEEGAFQLRRKDPGSAQLRQGPVLDRIAQRPEDFQSDFQAGIQLHQLIGHGLGLRHRQGASPRAEKERFRHQKSEPNEGGTKRQETGGEQTGVTIVANDGSNEEQGVSPRRHGSTEWVRG